MHRKAKQAADLLELDELGKLILELSEQITADFPWDDKRGRWWARYALLGLALGGKALQVLMSMNGNLGIVAEAQDVMGREITGEEEDA